MGNRALAISEHRNTQMSRREQLIAARAARGWSQQDVIKSLGINEATYVNWENNHNYPTQENLRALCRLFEATPLELGFLPQQIAPYAKPALPPAPLYNRPNTHLQAARHAYGKDQSEIASRLGIGQHTYNLLEEGVKIPSLPLLWSLCCLFDRSPADLGYPVYIPKKKE